MMNPVRAVEIMRRLSDGGAPATNEQWLNAAAGQVISDETFTCDLAGNRSKKTVLHTTGSPLVTVNYALTTGNRLGSWSVAETNLAGQVDVAGVSSEQIGTNDRFGWLYVSNAATSVRPVVSGTNFCVYDFTVGLGTQKIVAAIRDAAGNMGYATNTIVLSVVTNGAYQCSAAGCVTNIQYKGKDYQQSYGLTWDSQYRLTAVSTNGGNVERYGYDTLGRRVFTWDAANGTNWHVYDGAQVVADLNSTGGLVRAYSWGPGIDDLLAITVYGNATNTYYTLKDHLGSILALTDTNAAIVESYRYDAWGRTTVYDATGNTLASSAVGNRYGWQGREYSWKTGLHYFRARWYDPVTGRFLSNDPIGISGGLNQFVFCANNPVNFVDPTGLCQGDDLLPYVQTGNPWLSVPAVIANSVPFAVNTLHQIVRPIDWNDRNAPYFAVLSILGPEIQIAGRFLHAAKSTSKGVQLVEDIVGPNAEATLNEAGDLVIESQNGLTKVRFDINRTVPHKNPHAHVEVFEQVKNKKIPVQKSGPIYPKDVPHE